MMTAILSRRPRLTYRRLLVIFALVCLIIVSTMCLILNYSEYASSVQFRIVQDYYRKLKLVPDDGSTSNGSPLPVPTTNIHIKHQFEEFMEAKTNHKYVQQDLLPGSDFMRRQAQIQRQRKKTLLAACKRNPKVTRIAVSRENTPHMYALNRNRLFYCAIPKVGCTNWKKVFMVLEGKRNYVWNITGREAHLHNHFTNFTSMTPSKRNKILQTYPKLMYVRHPYIRLISAYRNKIACDISKQGKIFQKFSRRIVTKYRQGADLAELEAGGNYNVTFEEWIQYLTDPWEIDEFNHHWIEFYKICLPCQIQYDFIGNLETLEEDSTYMLSTLGLNRVKYPTSKSAGSSSQYYQDYFANISQESLQALWEIYKYDFELFGYENPNNVTQGPTSSQGLEDDRTD